MQSVLFVCTANICRSPTAAAVLRRRLAARGEREGFVVDSAGTHDYHAGKPAFPPAVEMAKRHGLDITHHVARRIRAEDFDRFGMILAMDRGNLGMLRSIAPTRAKPKIELLLEYGDAYHGLEVPDPFGEDLAAFARAMELIQDGCAGLEQVLVRAGGP